MNDYRDIGKTNLLVRGPILSKAVADGVIDSVNENVVLGQLVVDVHNFANLTVKVISILNRSHSDWLCVTKDREVHFGICLVISKQLEKVANNLGVY